MTKIKVGDIVKYKNGHCKYRVVAVPKNNGNHYFDTCIIEALHNGARYRCQNISTLVCVDAKSSKGVVAFNACDFVEHVNHNWICGYVIKSDAVQTSIRTASGRQFVSGTHEFARTSICEDFTMSTTNAAGFITGLSNTDLLRLAAAMLVIEDIVATNSDARMVSVTFDEDRAAENAKKRYDYLCPIAGVTTGDKGFVLAPDGQYKIVTIKDVSFLTSEDVVRRMATSGYENLSAILGIRNPTNSEPLSALFSKKIEELRAQTAVQQVNAFASQLQAGAGVNAPAAPSAQ